MLQHLTISHYALIEQLDIDIDGGFSVITGETGAGKSIILGALHLLLGGRAEAKSIQTGEKKCVVEATFRLDRETFAPFFADNDIDLDTEECIVRREVMQTGKSRAFINDTPVPAAKLKELGSRLIDIHSQHQNLLLHDEAFLIRTLDVLAGNAAALESYREAYHKHRKEQQTLHAMEEQARKGRQDEEFMEYQLSQLTEAQLQEDEQEKLEQEQNTLAHAEEIKQSLFEAQNLLNGEEVNLPQSLRAAIASLQRIAPHLPAAEELAERLQSARIELEDIAAETDSALSRVDYDPARLTYVEDRLSLIYELERKHDVQTVAELLALAADLERKLGEIENIDENIKQQQKRVDEALAQRTALAAKLTATRQKAAATLQEELAAALQTLGMPNARVEVKLTPRKEPDALGADNAELLFSANKNVPLQNVGNIASGGEIARVMLSLKGIIAQRTQLPTIVFDEIDTGVSGLIAERMAQTMKRMADRCQVICITHLPQIASQGNWHFRVYKEDSQDTTHSHIERLDHDSRIREIAHMLSGAELTDAAVNNAKALLGYGD